jgi:hypothetical protein
MTVPGSTVALLFLAMHRLDSIFVPFLIALFVPPVTVPVTVKREADEAGHFRFVFSTL